MAKRLFLMKLHTYITGKHGIGGWYISEKLDGMRCFWDGGLTRGMPKDSIPWANTAKDNRYVTKPVSTGLWSFYGNVISAPDSFLDGLPLYPLDGELYGDMPRQELMSAVKKLEPEEYAWRDIKLYVFDMPPLDVIFDDGNINLVGFKKKFSNIRKWLYEETDINSLTYIPKRGTMFRTIVSHMEHFETTEKIHFHLQEQLPFQTAQAVDLVNQKLDEVSARGGEGLVLRKPESCWVPNRVHDALKLKKLDDMEGTVIGYITGRETDKGSKLLGKMGALIVKLPNGKTLELSGFTDEERELSNPEWAIDNPETKCPEGIYALNYPIGTVVTFKYRGKSNDGIPQEARYFRPRED